MAGAINFSGITSGIDTTAIIQEMLTIDRQPEQFYKNDQTNLQQRQTAYQGLSAQLLTLQSDANSLDRLRGFSLVTATTSDNTVATVTAQTGAQTGTHTITVKNLAQAQMISTAAQSSQNAPLNFQGQILVNGKAINVQTADSLVTLAENINAAQAGVTASIINPTPGQYFLTLGSNNSGLQGKISISDVGSGNLLSQLGLFGNTSSISHQLTGSVGSDLFSDSATSVATLEGLTSPAIGNVQIQLNNGSFQNVSIDLTHSLSQIASDINTALGSNAASAVTVTNPITNASSQQLQIAGATGFVDNNNVLANLGIYQENLGAGRQLVQAQDASFTLDNLPATSPSNTITNAISGVTIDLLKDSTSNSGGIAPTATLTVSNDITTISKNINQFVTDFNSTVDYVSKLDTYDPNTGTTGVLFGDVTAQNTISNLTQAITSPIAGLPSNMSLLSQVGITLDQTGHLSVDNTALQSALSSNLQGVAKLFQALGTPSNPSVQFVTSSKDTQPSAASGYAVQVTQPATQAQFTTSTIQTQPLQTAETLTFAGPLFGTAINTPLQGVTLTLPAGSSASDIVSLINSNSSIGTQISASLDAQGHLQLTSKQYGTNAEFAVISSAAAAANSSGIGTSVNDVKGQDVQGTINGEPATGNGQFLTGSLQGGQANGLELRITATQPGSYGTVTYTSGVADVFKNAINQLTDPFNGTLTQAVNEMQTQYQNDQNAINDIEARVNLEQQALEEQFTNMETTMAQLKAAGQGLAALGVSVGSTTSSTAPGSSTSSSSSSSSGSSSGH